MPKTGKSIRGIAKRMKLTARGKIKRTRAGKSHLATALSPKRRRNLRGSAIMKAKGMVKQNKQGVLGA